jgi:hypothetical protein
MAGRSGLDCAFCILREKKKKLAAEQGGPGYVPEVVLSADTLWQGIAICWNHVTVTPDRPGRGLIT